MSKERLRQTGHLKAFLKRQAFPCPHCQQSVALPENAETMVSFGLFIAVILAPLFHFWNVDFIASPHLFALGLALICVGVFTQKLQKA